MSWVLVFIAVSLMFLFFNVFVPIFFFKEMVFEGDGIVVLRNYFSIMSSISSMAISGVGAYLGYYYFKSKKKHEDDINKRSRLRSRFEYIISELNKYDENVENIFEKKFSCEKELRLTRHKIRRSFENIESMLETNGEFLCLSDKEICTLIDVRSFIDNSEQIMQYPFDKAKNIHFPLIQEKYMSLIKRAKILCFTKSE